MQRFLNKRFIEVASVVLCIGMIIGIGVPVYTNIIKKASSIAASHNLVSAQQAIDVHLTDTIAYNPMGATYQQVDAITLSGSTPGISWVNFDYGDALPCFHNLTSKQKNSVHVVRTSNPDEIWIFTVTLDGELMYSHGIGGIWEDEGTVPYEQGIPGIVLIGG